MNFNYPFNFLGDMNDSEKQSFVRRWAFWHKKGLVFFMVSLTVLLMLFSLFKVGVGILVRSDPFVAASWTNWIAGYDWRFEAFVALLGGFGGGLLLWFSLEELYRNFKN